MLEFFNNEGVAFEHICTQTPRYNWVVERKHRHILNVASTIRFQAN